MDEKLADLIVEQRLKLKDLKTYSDNEVRNVQDEEELAVDEDNGWE